MKSSVVPAVASAAAPQCREHAAECVAGAAPVSTRGETPPLSSKTCVSPLYNTSFHMNFHPLHLCT